MLISRDFHNFDLSSYSKIGDLTLKGINIYPIPALTNHPYLPFYLYLEALAVYLSRFNINLNFFLKFTNIFFDTAITYLVYIFTNKNLKSSLIYALNPVTILVTSFHGQFDSMPIFFLLLSIFLMKTKRELFSIFVYSFSILTKTWPLLFAFIFWKKLKIKFNILYIFIFPIISVILYSCLFHAPFEQIISTLAKYQGLYGIWGVTQFLSFFNHRYLVQKLAALIFFISFTVFNLRINNKNVFQNFLFALLFFFSFTSGFSIQYLSWIVPFLLITNSKFCKTIIIQSSIYLLSHYIAWIAYPNTDIFPGYVKTIQNISGFILWFSFIKIWYISANIKLPIAPKPLPCSK